MARKLPPKSPPPKGKRQRWQPDSSAPATWNESKVRLLAELGVEQADIALALGLGPRLSAETELRSKFEAVVSRGHASFRVAVSKRLHNEGVSKGKASALLEIGRGWLSRYSEAMLSPEEEGGLVDRVKALLEKLAEAKTNA